MRDGQGELWPGVRGPTAQAGAGQGLVSPSSGQMLALQLVRIMTADALALGWGCAYSGVPVGVLRVY